MSGTPSRTERVAAVLAGAVAGLVGGLAMLTVQALLRAVLGLSPPPEAIPDRLAPLLTIEQFFRLLDLFDGYDGLKQFGVGSIIAAELGVAVLVGVAFGVRAPGGRGTVLLVAAVITAWIGSLLLLWPVLGANYRGLAGLPAAAASAGGLLAGYLAFALATAVSHRLMATRRSAPSGGGVVRPSARRTFLVGVAGIGGFALASSAVLRRLYEAATFDYDGMEYREASLQPLVPNDRFYSVTKNVVDPRVDPSWWRLDVGGLVDRPATYSLDDIQALPATSQETTLMCISNYIGGGLISNASWTGVPLRALLNAAGPRPGVVEGVLHAADGYSDTVPIGKLLDGTCLVAYQMNGEPLPRRHGGPVRLLIPGRFGEKSVKWVTGVDLVDRDVKGFYEQQGWGPSFVIPSRSQFSVGDFAAPLGSEVVVRGWAFAGDRGVSRVEVSTDEGQTWQAADIDYPGTRLTWSLWSFGWRPDRAGDYRLVVRATDGRGDRQSGAYRDTQPEGATGFHSIGVRVVA